MAWRAAFLAARRSQHGNDFHAEDHGVPQQRRRVRAPRRRAGHVHQTPRGCCHIKAPDVTVIACPVPPAEDPEAAAVGHGRVAEAFGGAVAP